MHRRCGEKDPRWLPAGAAGRSQLWLRSIFAGFLFAPQELWARRLQARAAVARFPPDGRGVLGMHVRRGDACGDAGVQHNQDCVATERYAAAARELAARYGLTRVLVATNGGPEVLRELREMLPDLEVRLLAAAAPRPVRAAGPRPGGV